MSKFWHFTGHGVDEGSNSDGEERVHPSRLILNYSMAVLFVALALAVSRLLSPILRGDSLFVIYVMASFLAAWFGGLGPGILALVVGLLSADFFFIEPVYQLGPNTPETLALMLVHLCAAGVGLAAIFYLHRARAQQRQIHVIAARLEREVEQRGLALNELHIAKSQIDDHARELENKVAERTARLVETVKSLQGVLYHVAHDLRAPLRSVASFTELLQESPNLRPSAEERDWMTRLVSSARRMDRLILDLLAYGELGHVRLELRQVDLNGLFSEVLARMDGRVKASRAVVEIVPAALTIRTDRGLLSRAVAELVTNALKFVPPGAAPHVRIWSEDRGGAIRILVQDNGIGIEPRYHKRVFNVFERLDPGGQREGTGIGLAIVAKIMECLGGSAGLESESGKGSTFWLELPRAPVLDE